MTNNTFIEQNEIDDIRIEIQKDIQRLVRNNYGDEGINTDYLVSLKYDTLKGSEYIDLKQCIDELKNGNELLSLRILLSGGEHSGRTAHLLNYCQELINGNSSNLVFFIPSYIEYSPIDYIYTKYLGKVKRLRQESNKENAFQLFVDNFARFNNGNITIIINNYDYINTCSKMAKSDFISIFINEEKNLLQNVDVIVKISNGRVEWKSQYKEISTNGYTLAQIEQIINKEKLSVNLVKYFSDCLYSPLFVKKLINLKKDSSLNFLTTIENDLETQIALIGEEKSYNHADFLRFVVYKLFPYICSNINKNFFTEEEVKKEIEKALSDSCVNTSLRLYDLISDHEHTLRISDTVYNTNYIFKTIIEEMALMSKRNGVLSKIEWKNQPQHDYFYSLGLFNHLIFLNNKKISRKKISRAVNNLSMQLGNIQRPNDTNYFENISTYFRRANFLRLLFIENNKLDTVMQLIPDEIIKMFYGIAEFYEFIGDQEQKYEVAKETLDLLQMQRNKSRFKKYEYLEMINTMSYYIIKYSNRNNLGSDEKQKYNKALDLSKKNLEYVRNLIESLENASPPPIEILNYQVNYKLLKSKVYGNLGAYYYNVGELNTAFDCYEKSFRLKDDLSHFPELGKDMLNQIYIGKIRSQICFGSYYYSLGEKDNFEKSVAAHKLAIEIGEKHKLKESLPSYNRIVGSLINLAESESGGWTEKAIIEMLYYLNAGLEKMGLQIDSSQIDYINDEWYVNIHELKEIQKKCEIIIRKIKESTFCKEDIQKSANKILTICQQITILK